jgi:hypothetical protein
MKHGSLQTHHLCPTDFFGLELELLTPRTLNLAAQKALILCPAVAQRRRHGSVVLSSRGKARKTLGRSETATDTLARGASGRVAAPVETRTDCRVELRRIDVWSSVYGNAKNPIIPRYTWSTVVSLSVGRWRVGPPSCLGRWRVGPPPPEELRVARRTRQHATRQQLAYSSDKRNCMSDWQLGT